MRRRSPYSLKGAPLTEGSRPKTRKEQYKRRTNILPLATCWRRTVCFVLPAGNFTITTRIGKRGSAGCISKDQKFRRDALPEWTRQYMMLGCRFDPSLLRARGSISNVWRRLAPGTGLRSPETGSQDQGYRGLTRHQRPDLRHLRAQKSPQIEGYSSETWKSRFVSDCVVVDAVR